MNAEIYNYIDANLAKMTGTLSELVAIPSVRGKAVPGKPYGEECARVLEKMLSIASSFGFKTENHKNRVGTIDLYPEGEPTLGILCHLDVVPAGSGWRTPPFSMFMSGGKHNRNRYKTTLGEYYIRFYASHKISSLKVAFDDSERICQIFKTFISS